jgi:5-hydroxyisourate hydrolase
MTALTTHVLDLTHGRPAAGLKITLTRLEAGGAGSAERLLEARTNADGRVDKPLLAGEAFQAGRYRLEFHVGDYFREQGVRLPEPAFLDVAPIEFGVADPSAHHHVPLLVSPYGYSTYRGS